MNKVKIEMIHDVVCSWCNIGYHHITDAISSTGIDVKFRYLPFELNPDMGPDGIGIEDFFIGHKGWADEKLKRYRRELVEKAEIAGTKIDFSRRTHYYNTHLAHRLIAEAEAQNLGQQVHSTLLRAYHAEGVHIDDATALQKIGVAAGMDVNSIDIALDRGQPSQAYNRAVERSKEFTVQSVPAFVFNRVELMVGSQSKSYFENYFTKFVAESFVQELES